MNNEISHHDESLPVSLFFLQSSLSLYPLEWPPLEQESLGIYSLFPSSYVFAG